MFDLNFVSLFDDMKCAIKHKESKIQANRMLRMVTLEQSAKQSKDSQKY